MKTDMPHKCLVWASLTPAQAKELNEDGWIHLEGTTYLESATVLDVMRIASNKLPKRKKKTK
jgi:hypothetical protein